MPLNPANAPWTCPNRIILGTFWKNSCPICSTMFTYLKEKKKGREADSQHFVQEQCIGFHLMHLHGMHGSCMWDQCTSHRWEHQSPWNISSSDRNIVSYYQSLIGLSKLNDSFSVHWFTELSSSVYKFFSFLKEKLEKAKNQLMSLLKENTDNKLLKSTYG